MNNLIWVDTETTGLDPEHGWLLELGITMTTPDLEILKERSWIFSFEKMNLGEVDDWPLKQHFLSGLFPLCLISDNSIGEIQDDALNTLRSWTESGTEEQYPMCGASVHFDRVWLKHHMPSLEAWFHYRNIDVSTVRGLCGLWWPDADHFRGQDTHRVTSDNRDAITSLIYYRELGFILGAKVTA